MKIGFNLTYLVPGEVGGSEVLLTNLIRAMLDRGPEFFIFALRGFKRAYPDIPARAHTTELPWSKGRQGLRILAEHSWIPWRAARMGIHLMHHGVGTTPIIKPMPTVVTLHDIQYAHYPENFVWPKRMWLRLNVPHTVRTCRAVCVPSEWVRKDVEQRLGETDSKLRVVPFGGENLFDEVADPDEVRAKYGLDRPFFLFPARAYPHKNHIQLVSAFEPLAEDADLVFTGPTLFRDKEIESEVRANGLVGRVRQIGLIPRGELAALYKSAVALTYPSRFEGFGASALEAMTLGCPVIASNAAAIPEVVGEGGILLDPDDTAGWTQAMSSVLNDPSVAKDLSAKGLARSRVFKWSDAATKQIEAYEKALA